MRALLSMLFQAFHPERSCVVQVPAWLGVFLFQIHIKRYRLPWCNAGSSVDPINIAAHVYLSLQEIRAKRNCSPTTCRPLPLAGLLAGEAPNIIPEDVILGRNVFVQWITRYPNISLTELKKSPFRQLLLFADRLVKEIASAPPLQNDSDMVKRSYQLHERMLMEPFLKIVLFLNKAAWGSDFASYT